MPPLHNESSDKHPSNAYAGRFDASASAFQAHATAVIPDIADAEQQVILEQAVLMVASTPDNDQVGSPEFHPGDADRRT